MLNRLLKKIREEGESRSVYELGNPAMIAGTFDYLRLESLINDMLGKAAGIIVNDIINFRIGGRQCMPIG